MQAMLESMPDKRRFYEKPTSGKILGMHQAIN